MNKEYIIKINNMYFCDFSTGDGAINTNFISEIKFSYNSTYYYVKKYKTSELAEKVLKYITDILSIDINNCTIEEIDTKKEEE